jgi:hypothetical protein
MVDKKIYQNFKSGLGIALGSMPMIGKKIIAGGRGTMGDFGRSILEAMKRKKKMNTAGAKITPRQNVDTYNKRLKEELKQ